MICNKCGKNNAEFYYKQTINGQTSEYALCTKCAEELKNQGKLNIKLPSLFDDYSIGSGDNGLFGLSELFGLPYGTQKTRHTEKKKCTLCASTFDELVKSGKVGCAKCYEVFEEELKKMIYGIHGNAVHTGAVPGKHLADIEKRKEIEQLKKEQQQAVLEQNYEQAAVIRDKIKELEKSDKEEK